MKIERSDITENPTDQNPSSPEFSKKNQLAELLLKKRRLKKQDLIDHLEGFTGYKLQGLVDFLTDEDIPESLDSNKIQNYIATYIVTQILTKKIEERLDLNSIRFIMKAFRISPNSTISYRKHSGLTLLMLACKNERNLDLLTLFAKEFEGDLNAISQKGPYKGYSVFSYCCFTQNLPGLRFLIESGASPNKGSICPLTDSLTNNSIQITNCLLNTTMVETIDVSTSIGGSTPIHLAAEHADMRTVARLIILGANPNAVSEKGLTPLHTALLNPGKNSTDICRYLILIAGVDVNTVYKGETPLFLSARVGNCEALKIIYARVKNPNDPMRSGPYKGHTLLSIAIVEGNLGVVLWLLQTSPVNLLSTVTSHEIRKITLIDLGARCLKNTPNLTQLRIYQALKTHWINTNPEQVRVHVFQLIKRNDVDRLEDWRTFIVSEKSVDPETGNTPVHLACHYGHVDVLRLMIDTNKMGMSPSSANHKGNTPMHIACLRKRATVLRVLFDYVDDCNIKNNDEDTPLDIAFSKNDEGCLRLLIARGARMRQAIPTVETALEAGAYALSKILLELIQPENESGRLFALLQKLVGKPNNELFVLISEKLLSSTSDQTQLLRLIVKTDQSEIALSTIASYEKRYGAGSISLLINRSIDSDSDNTVMHEACLKGNADIISALFELGGDLLKENRMRVTPLSLIEDVKTQRLLDGKIRSNTVSKPISIRHKPKIKNPQQFSSIKSKTAEIQNKISERQALLTRERVAPKAISSPKKDQSPLEEPLLPGDTELSPQAFKVSEPLLMNAPSIGKVLSSSLTQFLSEASQKNWRSSLQCQELPAKPASLHPDIEIHLMGLTLYIECKLKDIEESSPHTIMRSLQLLANCLDDLENYVFNGMISQYSPVVNLTRQVTTTLQNNDLLDFETSNHLKQSVIKTYKDIIEQSGQFHLNDPLCFATSKRL